MQSQTSDSNVQNPPTFPFQLPPLKYDYNALEPFIDRETMRLHYERHHQAYVDNLNKALESYPQLHHLSIEDLLRQFDQLPEAIKTSVGNHGGGHANHQFFWKIMSPGMSDARPSGDLSKAISDSFGSFENFKQQFHEAGTKHFGSGWVFLVVNSQSGKLEVFSRPNQDSVLIEHKPGLLCSDVWEHAHYLKYQNKRADYLNAWWQTVNWNYIGERFEGIRAGKGQL